MHLERLLDPQFESWQGHGWVYIMIPLSDEWCEDTIVLNTCYVEGSMDVVNRKRLVRTHQLLTSIGLKKTPCKFDWGILYWRNNVRDRQSSFIQY